MNQISQFFNYTISWKLAIFMFIIFVLVNLFSPWVHILPIFSPYDITIAWLTIDAINYFFVQIPGIITPWTILSNFTHMDFFHIAFNVYVLYVLWPMIENISWKDSFIKLVIFSMIFSIVGVFFFSSNMVLWFSGIVMWMLAYAYFNYKTLWWIRTQIWFFLVLNILIWLSPMISFVWHLAGALGGYVYYLYQKNYER